LASDHVDRHPSRSIAPENPPEHQRRHVAVRRVAAPSLRGSVGPGALVEQLGLPPDKTTVCENPLTRGAPPPVSISRGSRLPPPHPQRGSRPLRLGERAARRGKRDRRGPSTRRASWGGPPAASYSSPKGPVHYRHGVHPQDQTPRKILQENWPLPYIP